MKSVKTLCKRDSFLISKYWFQGQVLTGILFRYGDSFAPYSCSLLALLSATHAFFPPLFFLFLLDAIFALHLCLTPASEYHLYGVPGPHIRALMSPGGEFLEMSDTPAFISCHPIFVAATLGTSLDHLALKIRRACVSRSHGIVIIRDSFWQTAAPGTLYN